MSKILSTYNEIQIYKKYRKNYTKEEREMIRKQFRKELKQK